MLCFSTLGQPFAAGRVLGKGCFSLLSWKAHALGRRLEAGAAATSTRRIPAALWLACAAVFLVAGCASAPPPTPDKIAQEFPPAQPTEPQRDLASDLDLYVDDSGSMRGFVQSPHANYRVLVGRVLESAAAADLHTSVYAVSSQRVISSLPQEHILSAAFYNGPDTPLAALVRRIAAQPTHVALVISDMVESERGVDNLGLQAALVGLARQMPQVRLLGYRSDYIGPYVPESRISGGARLEINASQSVPNAGRPFYLLAIAPNAASMQRLDQSILDRLPSLQTLDFSQPAFSVKSVSLNSAAGSPWLKYSNFIRRNHAYDRFEDGFELKKARTGSDTVDLPVSLAIDDRVPVYKVEDLDLAGESAVWDGNFTQRRSVKVPVTGSVSPDGSTLSAVLTLPNPALVDDKKANWQVYDLHLNPGAGNLNPPQWVVDWSTEDDSSPRAANRTYHLAGLVKTLETAITEHQACGEWILKIERAR